MGARAEQLAKKFDESCAEFNKIVEGLSDADWTKVTSAEKWPVGVVAHHLAEGHANVGGLVHLVAKAQPLPGLTWEVIHANNAKHAKEQSNVTKAAALALLKANGGEDQRPRPRPQRRRARPQRERARRHAGHDGRAGDRGDPDQPRARAPGQHPGHHRREVAPARAMRTCIVGVPTPHTDALLGPIRVLSGAHHG